MTNIIGGIFLVMVGLFLLSKCSDSGNQDNPQFACIMAEKFVRAHLKAPSTADFSSCAGDNAAIKTDDGWWSAVGYVDAQNGFGAKIRSTWVAEVRRSGSDEWQSRKVAIIPPG